MKPLILSLGLLVTAKVAMAQNTLTPLQADMRQISADFKAISAAAADPTKNQASAAAAQDMENQFTNCLDEVPDAISALPAADQAAALADYKRLITDEINQASALVTAFNTNQNSAATAILSAMSADKSEGHSKYNP